jgi:glycosyltransferase involved in cell wall biosynthesis
LISIITVNFNNEKGLKKTVSSVLSQTFAEFEYIIIDGGSNDGSKAYLESIESALSYWVSEPDKGIYNAMNKGIQVAQGDYVLFLNSGDHFYTKDALQHFKSYIMQPDAKDIYYGDIAVVSDKAWVKTYPTTLNFAYFVKDTLPHPASLIKRSCFKDVLYDEQLKIVSDWKFFMIGICKKAYTYKHIDDVISTFYVDGISSNEPQLVQQEKAQVLNAQFYLSLQFLRLKQKVMRKLNRYHVK